MITYPPGETLSYSALKATMADFIHVPVQAQDRDLVDVDLVQGLRKEALDEYDIHVEQVIVSEIPLDFLQRHSQRLLQMMLVASVGRISFRIGRRKALKQIGNPDFSVRDAVHREKAFHENARAPAPYARLDEVAWNAVPDYIFHARSQVTHSRGTDHRVGGRWPVSTVGSPLRIILAVLDRWIPNEAPDQGVLEQIEIELHGKPHRGAACCVRNDLVLDNVRVHSSWDSVSTAPLR